MRQRNKPAGIDDDDATRLATAARRRFLASLGLLGVATSGAAWRLLEHPAMADANDSVEAGVDTVARDGETRADASRRYGLLVATDKCASDCDACVRACNDEHGIEQTDREDIDAQWIRKVDLTDRLSGAQTSLPMLCQHCADPPCVDVCPTGASFVRADGIVLVNKHTCIGCRYCMMACPYKARSFIHRPLDQQKSWAPRGKGTVESCTFCVHRIDADDGREPACVEACDTAGHGALVFGDLNDPASDIAKQLEQGPSVALRDDLELNTAVRYARI